MNKKILSLIVGILAIALVSAGVLIYYTVFAVTINVNQPITTEYDGEVYSGWTTISEEVPCEAGESCLGKVIRVYNNGDEDREVTISSTINENVPVKYVGLLGLSQKNTDNWEEVGIKATVKYTVVGDEFEAKVIGEGTEPAYELIYYKDKIDAFSVDDRKANPQLAIRIADISGDLPYADDGNAQEGANYRLAPDNYAHPRGAKLWYVASSDINSETSALNWVNWGNFLYETELIRYFDNSEGKIVVPAGDFVEFYVEYSPNQYLPSGLVEITTTIA